MRPYSFGKPNDAVSDFLRTSRSALFEVLSSIFTQSDLFKLGAPFRGSKRTLFGANQEELRHAHHGNDERDPGNLYQAR